MNDFKNEIATLLKVDSNMIDNIFSGCSMLSEAYGTGDVIDENFQIKGLSYEESDEDEELENFREHIANGDDVDMTEHSFFYSETFLLIVNGVTVKCFQSMNKHVEEDFEYDNVSGELVKKDWVFTGAMELSSFTVEIIN